MIRLQLFGYPALLANSAVLNGAVSQRHRLALLSLLERAPGRTMARDKVLGLLWPESDTGDARHLLNTCVHAIRRAGGDSILVTTHDEITLAPAVRSDVADFEQALAQGDNERAVDGYRAPFLDGFYLDGAADFEQWASRERDQHSAAFRAALEALADKPESAGDFATAIRWWRRLTHDDPLNSRATMRLMLALEQTGDHGNALELACQHEQLLATELEAEPSTEFRELVRRMRSAPNGSGTLTSVSQQNARATPEPSSHPAHTARDTDDASQKAARGSISKLVAALGALTVASAAAAVMFVRGRAPDERGHRVLVVPFSNATGDLELTPLGRVTSAWIVDALTRTGALDIVEAQSSDARRDASAPALADPIEAARHARASFVVSGALHLIRDSVRFQATVRDVRDGRVLSSIPPVTGDRKDPMTAVENVRSRLAGSLSALVDPRLGRAATTIVPPLYPAYLEYLAGLEQLQTNVAQTHFYEAARLDTTFSLAIIWTAYALDRCQNASLRRFNVNCPALSWDSLVAVVESRRARLSTLERHALDFTKAWRAKDHRFYYESAKAAAQLVPVSFWTAHAFMSAIDLGRNQEAMSTSLSMRDVPLFDRVFPAYRAWLRTRFHEEGWFDDELEEVRRVERSPGPLNPPLQILSARASALAALGMIDSALHVGNMLAITQNGIGSVATASRELRAHGHIAAADSMARLCTSVVNARQDSAPSGLLDAAFCAEARRDVKEARRLFEECCIGGNYPQVMLLAKLGAFAALEGDTAAARRYSAAIDTLPIAKASNTRWFANEFVAEKLGSQAMIAAALGDGPGAVALLQRSFSEWGGRRLQFRHQQLQPEYDRVRSYPSFQRLVASLPRPLRRPVSP